MNSPTRIFFGAIAIMAVATLIGILHNSVRSRPIPLLPQSITPSHVNSNNATEAGSQGQDAQWTSGGSGEMSEASIVTTEQVKLMLDDPFAFIVDARSEEEYGKGHIPGAINVPYDRFADLYNQVIETIPTDATVVCYCRSETCDFSDHLAGELRIAGYDKVFIFRDGWDAWVEAGNETERE